MKKKLALILSIVLALSVAICIFAFSASAEELPYAETQAANLWGSSEIAKATSVTVGSTVIDLTTDGTGSITEGGTYAVKDGKLTLTNVGTSANVAVNPNGGLWLEINNGGAKADLSIGGAFSDTATGKSRMPLILTSADGATLCRSLINRHGDIILMGKVGMDYPQTGYHSIIIRDADCLGKGYEMILGSEADIFTSGNVGAMIQSNSGNIVFAGSGTITINQNTVGGYSGTGVSLNGSKADSAFKIIEDVNVVINTKGGLAANIEQTVTGGKDAVLIDTTGTVKISSEYTSRNEWVGAIRAAHGSIRVKSGTVLVNSAVTKWEGASSDAWIYQPFGFLVSNNGSSPEAGFFVEGNAEVVVNMEDKTTENANKTANLYAVRVRNGLLKASGNAKLSTRVSSSKEILVYNYAITDTTGLMTVADNAKVYGEHLGKAGNAILVNGAAGGNAAFTNNAGLVLSGGQLEVTAPLYAVVTNTQAYGKTMEISGGVFLIRSGSNQCMGRNPNNGTDSSVANNSYLFAGPISGNGNSVNTRNGDACADGWAYFGNNATYSYYNGILQHAADMPGWNTVTTAAGVIASYDAASSTYKLKIPASTSAAPAVTASNDAVRYKVNDSVYSLAKNGVILSSEPVTIEMTNDAVAYNKGYVSYTDNGVRYYFFDDPTDDVATVRTVANGGTVSYNDKTQDVVLNGVVLDDISIYAPDANVKATLIGANSVKNKFSFESLGGDDINGTATITGDANATLTITQPANQYTVYAGRNMVLSGDFSLTGTTAKPDFFHTGNGKGITFQDNVKVTVTSSVNRVIRTQGNIAIKDNASVTMTGTTEVVFAQGSMHLTGGSLTATGNKEVVKANNTMNINGTANVNSYAVGSPTAADKDIGHRALYASNINIAGDAVVHAEAKTRALHALKGFTVADAANVTLDSTYGDAEYTYAQTLTDGEQGKPETWTGAKRGYIRYTGVEILKVSGGITLTGGKVTVTGNNESLVALTGDLNVSDGELTATSITAQRADGVWTEVAGATGGDNLVNGYDKSNLTGCNVLRMNGNVNISGGKVNLTGYMRALHMDGGTVNVTGGELNVNCRYNGIQNLGRVINVDGGVVNSNGNEAAILADTLNVKSGTVNVSAIKKTINVTNLNVSGGKLVAEASDTQAIYAGNMNVTGGIVDAAAPVLTNYTGVASVKNYSQTAGEVTLGLKGLNQGSTAIGLHFYEGTGSNFEGGKLTIKCVDSVKANAVYGIWSNSTDLNFNGTTVEVDTTDAPSSSTYVAAVKIQGNKSLNVNDGKITFRGRAQHTMYRADSGKLNLNGGESIGVGGYFVGTNDDTTNVINVTDNAKVDYYYYNGVKTYGKAAPAETVTSNWLKNCAWADAHHWLTTGNWSNTDVKVRLTLNDGTVFEMDKDTENRTYPAGSASPYLALSISGELIILDAAPLNAGIITRIESKGDLTLNIPAAVTVNLGNASANYVLDVNGSLKINGSGTLNVIAYSRGIVAIDDLTIDSTTVSVEAGANGWGIVVSNGDLSIRNAKVTANAKTSYEGIVVFKGDVEISNSTVDVDVNREGAIRVAEGSYVQQQSNVSVKFNKNDGTTIHSGGLVVGADATVDGGSLTVDQGNCASSDRYDPIRVTGTFTMLDADLIVKASGEKGNTVKADFINFSNVAADITSNGNGVLRGENGVTIAKSNITATGSDNIICGYGTAGLVIQESVIEATAAKTSTVRGNDIFIYNSTVKAHSTTEYALFTNGDSGNITIFNSNVQLTGSRGICTGKGNLSVTDNSVLTINSEYQAINVIAGTTGIYDSTVNVTTSEPYVGTSEYYAVYSAGDMIIDNSKVKVISATDSDPDQSTVPYAVYTGGDFTLGGDDSVLVVKLLSTKQDSYGPRAIEAAKNLYFNGGKLFINCDEGSTVTVNADGTITHNLINPTTSVAKFVLKSGGASTTMNFNGTDAVIAGYQQVIHTQGGNINVNAGTVSVISTGNYAPVRLQNAGTLNVSGGTLNLVGTQSIIEKYNQNGGTVNAYGSGDAINTSGANIAYNISDGNFNVRGGSCGIRLNASTKGEFNVTGGNVNITAPGQVLYLNGSATNNVNFSGGTTTITHNTVNSYRPIQVNGTGTVTLSGDAKLYALGNGYHSIQATNFKISEDAYAKVTTKENGGGAYFAIAATNMTVEGGTLELSAGSTSVVNATNYTQTAGTVSIKTQPGGATTGLRSMNANITGGSIDFALSHDAFEAANGNAEANHNGIVNIGGTATVTGYAARFLDANTDAQLNISGNPVIDFYNVDGTSLRDLAGDDPAMNTGDVQFVKGCKPQDKTFFVTTASAVNGDAPSMIVVIGNDNSVNRLYNEDGKRTYGGATRTGEKTVDFEGLNAKAVRANGELIVTVKGANNVLNTTQNNAFVTYGGNLSINGTANDVLSVTGNQRSIHTNMALNVTGLKLIAKGNAGYAINPVGTGTFTNANLVVGCDDGSTFASIKNGIAKEYIIQSNGGLIFKNTKAIVYGTSNLLHSNSHAVGIQILEGSKIDAVSGNTRALRAQHGDLLISGAGTVVNVKAVAATWGESCVHVQGQTDVSDFIISDGAVVNMESNGAANGGIVVINKGSLILDNGQLLLNNKGSSPTAKDARLGLIHAPTGNVSITNDSYLEMKGSGHTSANVVAGGSMTVEDSKVKIEKTHDDVLRITGKLVIKDSDAEIYGGYNNAVYSANTIEITNSIVNVNAYKGYAMQATKGISVVDSSLYVNTKRTSTLDNIIPDVTFDSSNNYCIQTNGNLVFDGSTVIVYGNHNVVHMNNAAGAISFLNGTKAAIKAEDQYAVRAQAGNIVITDATVMAEALYHAFYTQVGKFIVNSGFVSAQTNATEADFKAAQDTYNAIANPTWADANTKKSRVRILGSNLIRGEGGVEINGGTVLAGTENGMGNECAIYSASTFKMTGGTVKAYVMYNRNQYGWQTDNENVFNQGPASRDKSNMTGCYGIRIKGNIDITGGELIVGARTQGIRSDSGNINIGGDAKVDIKVSENGGIFALANTNVTIDCAELTINAKYEALRKDGSNKNSKIDILGGDIVLNANYEAIDVAGGTLTFGGDANVTANVVNGTAITAQYAAAKMVIKDDVKLNVNMTAMKDTWKAAISAFDLEMLDGDVNVDIDCAPFAKYEQRVLTAINVQGTDVYNLGVMNLKGGNIYVDIDNNYNDAGYTIKDGDKDTKSTNANRTYGFFLKNASVANFDGTNVEINLHTLMANGSCGHIAVQDSPTTINVNAGKLAFNSTGDITSLFYHTANGAKINLNGGEITGSANYFWHSLGGMNKVLTVKPGMKIDFFNYSADAVNLGTYNANNQSYYNWFVEDGVEYLPNCSLKANTQFVTTGNMTVEGAATQVEIKVKEGSALKTYALTVLAKDPDSNTFVPNRAYPAGAGPMDAKAYLKANGELILNDLAAQSLVFNGNIDVDLNGTSTLVKNGTHTINGSGDITIGGDGVLEMSGTDYVLYTLGNEITFNDKAQVKIIATKGNGVHMNNTEDNTTVNILDDAKVVIEATENFSVDKDGKVTYSNNGRGIYIRGIETVVNVGDNAVLDITSTDQGIYALSNNGKEGDVTKAIVNIGDNAKVNIEANSAIYTVANVSAINVNGDAVVTMPEVAKAFYATGADASVNIGGNAQVLVDKSVGDGLTIQSNTIAPEGVKQNASLTVSGKANFVISDAASCGARIAITATDLDKKTVPGSTAFIVSDEANVEMTAGGQTVYLLANGTGGSAKFAITDKATATLVNDSPTSQYGAAVQINSPENDVDITTSGIVNVHGKSATWNGAFFVTGGAVSTDILIKDATLNVTNIQDTEFEILDANKKNTFGGEISNAMYVAGKGTFEITGDAVVNAYAERNGTKYNNRAHGLFLSPDMSLVLSGNADATFAAGGDSKANTGAGIHLKESDITVTDNATLRANATENAVAGITFEGVSSLTVNKYGVVLVDGGKDAVGIRGYNKSADVDIIVKDGGHAQFTGKPALDLKAGTFEYSVSKVIAGKDKESSKETAITVVQREYKDMGYVVLKGQMRNPSTSDYVITYVVVAAILAAAAAVAVIVIRKKKSQD